MQAEILTRNVELKNRFLTRYAPEPEFWAAGDRIKVPGLEIKISSDYLLFNITSPELAEEVTPLLFTVTPVSTAGQLYEPATDMKMIVTARCREPGELLPHMHQVNHLDLERGELLGIRLTEWRSRNVAVVARAEVAVQGGILVAKIKFSTHSRDSRFNCQECVNGVSLRQLLEPLCPGFAAPPPVPRSFGPLIQAVFKTPADKWARFVSRRPAPVEYCRATDTFKIVFSSAGQISFQQENDRREITCRLETSDPSVLDDATLDMLHELGLPGLTASHRVENILLPPDRLIGQLGFRKEQEFHLLSLATANFTAVYDVKKLVLTLEQNFKLENGPVSLDMLQATCTGMVDFSSMVVKYAPETC